MPLTHIVVETTAENGMGEVAVGLRVTEKTRWTIDIWKYSVKLLLFWDNIDRLHSTTTSESDSIVEGRYLPCSKVQLYTTLISANQTTRILFLYF